jgi:hypothetical protein
MTYARPWPSQAEHLADLLGRMSVHHDLKRSQRLIGLGGAVVGIGVGLWGATRRNPRRGEMPAG